MTKVRFFIPTRDSAKWIGPFLDAYRHQGVEPFYVVDVRSADATVDILRQKRADFHLFEPSGNFVEAGMLEVGSNLAGSRWVVRLDDDEFPSRYLLEWIAARPSWSANQAFWLSRRELFAREGIIYSSRALGRYPSCFDEGVLQPQLRMYDVRHVDFVNQVHTPGITTPFFTQAAPAKANFIHLNCLLRSPAERLRKIETYEALAPGSTLKIGDEYLPEIFSLAHHRAETTGLDEFSDLFNQLPIDKSGVPPRLDVDFEQRLRDAVAEHAIILERQYKYKLQPDGDHPYFALTYYRLRGLWKLYGKLLQKAGHEARSAEFLETGKKLEILKAYSLTPRSRRPTSTPTERELEESIFARIKGPDDTLKQKPLHAFETPDTMWM